MHSRAETHHPKKHDKYKYSLNFAAPKAAWNYQTEMGADDEYLKRAKRNWEAEARGRARFTARSFNVIYLLIVSFLAI